jgi:drug/metabolite transporter (DMT)-like permease
VNPVVALLLGWLIAGEGMGAGVLLAGVSIVGAVALLRRGEARTPDAHDVERAESHGRVAAEAA